MIKRAKRLARRGVIAYVRAFRNASPNARRYLAMVGLENVSAGLISTVFALYVRAAGMSTSVVGDVEGALALGVGAVCLLLPPLVSFVGYRRLFIIAAVAYGASRLVQISGVAAAGVVAIGLLFGIADGIIRSVGVAFLSEDTTEGDGRTMLFTIDFVLRVAAAVVGSLLGGLIPTVLSGVTTEVVGLRWAIGVAVVLYLAAMVPALSVTQTPRVRGGAWTTYVAALRGFRSWDRLIRLTVPQALISMGAGLIMPFMPLLLRAHLNASVAQVGFIMSAMSVVMAFATLTTPLLAKRFGLAGTVSLTEIVSLPFLLMIPLSGALPVVAVAMWARAALMNMSSPVYNQLAVDGIPDRDKSFVVGWTNVVWSLAWLFGSVVGGRLAETTYTAAYFATAVLYLLGACASWVLLRHVSARPLAQAESLAAESAELHA